MILPTNFLPLAPELLELELLLELLELELLLELVRPEELDEDELLDELDEELLEELEDEELLLLELSPVQPTIASEHTTTESCNADAIGFLLDVFIKVSNLLLGIALWAKPCHWTEFN